MAALKAATMGATQVGLARRARVLWLLMATCALALAAAPQAMAGASRLQVGPTLIELANDRQAEALWLSNSGAQPLPVQVRVFRWLQDQDGEHLEPTGDLIVSPAQTTIAPGQRQMVRILRRGPAQDREQAFRLIVDELPQLGTVAGPVNGLQFRLRYSVPAFVAARTQGGPELAATLALPRSPESEPMLLVSNAGAGRAQLAEVALLTPDGKRQVLADGLLGYVLTGRAMRWPVKAMPASAPLGDGQDYRLQFRLNAEPSLRTVPLRTVRQP